MGPFAAWCHAKHGRQKELARALGVSDQWVSNWVTGMRIPNLEHGLRIQVFLRRHSRRPAPRFLKKSGRSESWPKI